MGNINTLLLLHPKNIQCPLLHTRHGTLLLSEPQSQDSDESQKEMHEKIDYLIAKQIVQFSCVDTMSSIGSKFDLGEVETEEGHNNSSNGSKGGIATKEFLKRRCGQQLPSKSDETELKPPTKSPETKYPYYKQFPL